MIAFDPPLEARFYKLRILTGSELVEGTKFLKRISVRVGGRRGRQHSENGGTGCHVTTMNEAGSPQGLFHYVDRKEAGIAIVAISWLLAWFTYGLVVRG